MVFMGNKFILWSVVLAMVLSHSTSLCAVPGNNGQRSVLPLMMKGSNSDATGTKIVGGYPAAEGEVPWQVGLLRFGGSSLFCGGTLISQDVVLTAAHCVVSDGVVFEDFQVGYGGLNQPNLPIKSAVKKVLPHENYNENTIDNDIALLILEDPVDNFTSLVYPAELPINDTQEYAHKEVTVSGWGTLFSGAQTLPEQLQVVQVNILQQDSCEEAYSEQGITYITDNMLCAGVTDLSKDSCQGDSGGPLVMMSEDYDEVVGIVSWGAGCAEDYPGVYTRVTRYLDWIRDTACSAGAAIYEDDDCIRVTEDPITTEHPTTDAAAHVMGRVELLVTALCALILLIIIN